MDTVLIDGELNFNQALDLMKAGKRLARLGWNGKDQWVVRQNGYPDGIPINRNTALATGMLEGTVAKFEPYYMMFTAWGTFVPWTPSTGDLNASDWEIYQTSEEMTAEIAADPHALADLAESAADIEAGRLISSGELLVLLEERRATGSPAQAALAQATAEVVAELVRSDTLLVDTLGDPAHAVTVDAFVRVVTRLQGELKTANEAAVELAFRERGAREALDDARPGWWEEEGANMPPGDAIRALARERDEARAELAATELGNPMFGVDELERFAIALAPTLADWRQRRDPDINTDGWVMTINGRHEKGLGDRVTSYQLEKEAHMLGYADEATGPERTQDLVKPGDPNYPTRPQRLTETMKLRQSYPDEVDATTAQPPQLHRYFVTLGDSPEAEVTREEWVSAERRAGFRPKGEDRGQPATGGFSGTAGFLGGEKVAGRIEYGQQELPQQP